MWPPPLMWRLSIDYSAPVSCQVQYAHCRAYHSCSAPGQSLSRLDQAHSKWYQCPPALGPVPARANLEFCLTSSMFVQPAPSKVAANFANQATLVNCSSSCLSLTTGLAHSSFRPVAMSNRRFPRGLSRSLELAWQAHLCRHFRGRVQGSRWFVSIKQ